ncbi:RimK family alpha-L-glutamate ligase [Streptacidiphilus sp. EB129]|uniref:ATP-grasp domain-containing protein n=1 Tax=Streptacidiphilus sp. EB129 TaxID=3156262 RepID=UPI0035157362
MDSTTGSACDGSPFGASALDRFARVSRAEFIDQLARTATVCVPRRRPGLLEQLRDAARLGIATPRTLVGVDAAAAAAALTGPRIVVKALGSHFVESGPGLLTGVFAEVLDRAELLDRSEPAGPPMVFQEYVEHQRELRVYYVHGELHAYAVAKSSPAEPWLSPAAVRVRAVRPPDAVLRAARTLAEAWELHYCAFDFLLRAGEPAGEPVFLEANLNGDWRWFETAAGDPRVTHAAVRMLRALHRRESAGDGAGIDLLSFLCG